MGEIFGFIGFIVVTGIIVAVVYVLLGGDPKPARDRFEAARSDVKALAGTARRLEAVERELAEVKARLTGLEAGLSNGPRPGGGDASAIPPATAGSPAIARVLELLGEGRKIEAIKAYREATGVGLAEAKDVVEAFERGVGD